MDPATDQAPDGADLRKIRKLEPRVQAALSRGLCDIVVATATGRITVATAVKRLRAAADWLEAGALSAPRPAPVESLPSAEVKAIFDHWHQETQQSAQVKLTSKRRSVIEARLRSGYTPDQLCTVIDWCAQDPHWQGDNDRGEAYMDRLDSIFRNDEKVDERLRKAERLGLSASAPATGLDRDTAAKIERLEEQAEEALREGRTDVHNEIQRDIQALLQAGSDRPVQ